ncbi:MAG: hypothetical protein C0596_10995 [Marinilabiliales bacterium]|nr:MAG: hypothetical protein C0596_10995 [Marinilabiliales bacterium]
MKRILFSLFLGIIISASLFSAKPIVPPGTVKVNDSLFIDKTEVRNIDYREFLYWTKEKYGIDSKEYISILPDTAVWSDDLAYNEPMAKLYFRHPAYSEYPLVGVSYDQAVMYCEWRSDRVNEMLFIKINKLNIDTLKTATDIPKYVNYRLPSVEEWEAIAQLPYSKRTQKKFRKKKMQGVKKYNLISRDTIISMSSDMSDITAPAESYWPNKLGVYNIIGNVAEMTSQKELAKGGSWKHEPEEVTVESNFEYDKPHAWLGFRCICDVLIEI